MINNAQVMQATGNARNIVNRCKRTGAVELAIVSAAMAALLMAGACPAGAQNSVLTQHNDIARTGQNTNETILTPANVNTSSFGKLFSYPVDGWVYAQPLCVPGVTMGAGTPQAGTTHNVVFVSTEHDSVYAFDADSNAGANANPLWHITLMDTAHGAAATGVSTVPNGDVGTGDIVPEIGITSTAVIDPATNTMYVVGKTKENGNYIQRLHALDITTGAEKFGGPVTLSGSVPGNGNGSSGGTLNWDPKWENNRPGLLLLNGIVYIGFGSHGDNGPWHGWILAYNASTLSQTGVWCASPNGAADGIWMSGAGLAADVPAGKPFGRIFTSTGNGTHSATTPYDNTMNYGDSIIKLDLNNGVPTMNSGGTVVGDDFTPHDQANLNNGDTDQASGGALLLPDSVGGGGHQLIQVGKTGRVYVLDRENLGGYNPNNTKDPEEKAYVAGMWSSPTYWNGNVYFWGNGDNLKAFSFANGAISANPTSTSVESSGFPGATPSISANGTTNGILWSVKTDNYGSQGREILYAHDATNVAKLLYSTEQNVGRDNPGNSVKFIVPTVMNGKVYFGSETQLNIFGLLNGAVQAATPAISPAGQSFNPSIQVTITESTAGASVYYTTDGTAPTTASTKYTAPFTLTTTTTVNAIAAGPGLLQSAQASATYTLVTQVATPTFTPAPGAYTSVQSVAISTTTPNATIYYTIGNSTPTTSSAKYTSPISVGATETLNAMATASGLSNSPVASGLYTIDIGGVSSINFGSGFTAGGMALLGSAKLNGTSLRLTDGGGSEAAAAWYNVQANITNFTTDFTFLITPGSSPTADGFAFVMQANNASAIGPLGGGLGYGPDTTTGTPGIANSVAIKFDLYSNAGEGVDSTGLYVNGASPTTPFVDMTGSAVDLHSSHPFHVHMTYDGTNLVMTITDTTTNGVFTHTWPINIPGTVGGNTAYVGFTGGTGGLTAIQDIQNWTFASNGTQATLSSIAVTPANPSAAAGTTVQFKATGTYSDNSVKDITTSVTWTSSTTAATITSAGLATAVTAGQSPTITATSGSVAGSTTLTVTAATLNSIAVTPANPSAAAGTTVQFKATGTYSDNSVKDITTSVTWTSSTTAATITAGGLATAVTAGQAPTISAKLGSITGSTTLTVTAAALTSIAVTPSAPSLLPGAAGQFKATGTYTDNSVKDITTSVTWASSNTAAATITAGGLATAVTAGQVTTISAKSGAIVGSTTLTVTAATLNSIAVTPANPSAAAGTTVQFKATGTYSDNSVKDITTSVTWSSSTTAATITAGGLATAVTAGQSPTISAKSGSITGSTTLTVTAATLNSIAVTPANSSAATGTTVQFKATGTYSDNSAKDITASVTWSSSNLTAATINSAGLATAGTAGQSTTISAKSGSVSGSTSLSVTSVATVINYGSGFTAAGLALNGKATLNSAVSPVRLRLTDGGGTEAGSGWFTTLVNVTKFTTDFTFQISAGATTADGFTFAIQNTGTTALGPSGGGLGYGPDSTAGALGIGKSVAVKFDLYNNAGEGTNSTGIYTNGASPTVPATTLGGGVDLHSGDLMSVHMTYDGTTLTMTITDTTNTTKSFTTSWAINIPATVGGNTAYVGFTGGTGGQTATQEIATWSYSTTVTTTKTPVVYRTATLPAVSSGPTFRTFTYAGFPDTTGTILDATKVGDNVTFTVNVATAGTYDVKVSYKKFNTRGIWQLAINGTNLGATLDEFQASGDAYAVVDLGNFTFSAAGNYSFKFTVTSHNASSSGYTMSFDDFTLTPQ